MESRGGAPVEGLERSPTEAERFLKFRPKNYFTFCDNKRAIKCTKPTLVYIAVLFKIII